MAYSRPPFPLERAGNASGSFLSALEPFSCSWLLLTSCALWSSVCKMTAFSLRLLCILRLILLAADVSRSLPFNLARKGKLWAWCLDSSSRGKWETEHSQTQLRLRLEFVAGGPRESCTTLHRPSLPLATTSMPLLLSSSSLYKC